ncbi:MAG: Fe-S protein assembly chaperone HscA [Zavarzinella sp.]
MSTQQVVGIDLGTTNSLAAFIVDGQPQVVRDAAGTALVPSVLHFQRTGRVTVGSAARKMALEDPESTVFSVKRLMGRSLEDLQAELPHIPHQLTEHKTLTGRKVLHVQIGQARYTPEELSAMILREVRQRAGNPTKAVITVPAYFDDSQRQATRDAGRIAGLDVLRIINEPTAAALAYGLNRKDGTVVVYDFGGGTFDCSILAIKEGLFQVLSTNGDTHLGGDDIDRLLVDLVRQTLPPDVASQPLVVQTLRAAAEEVKIALTTSEEVTYEVNLPQFGIEWRQQISRTELEGMMQSLIERTLDCCRRALRDAELTVAEIDEVVLVGGSTRIPYVRKQVEALFQKPPHCELNPDEVVALGAAIQGDILAGNRKDMVLMDVIPLSLGIETFGGVMDKVIFRNAPVPTRETRRYSNAVDGQTHVELNVYQGERELIKDCQFLGKFKLAIPPLPAQFAQVDVTFQVDENGQLTVAAKELRSGSVASVTVQPAHGLSQDEVDRLVLESVDHAEVDFQERRLIEFRSKAHADLNHTSKGLALAGKSLSPEQKERVIAAVAGVQQTIDGTSVDALQDALKELAQATIPLAEQMMNAVVKQTLTGKTEAQLDQKLLEGGNNQ